MSPKRFDATTTSNQSGCLTKCADKISINSPAHFRVFTFVVLANDAEVDSARRVAFLAECQYQEAVEPDADSHTAETPGGSESKVPTARRDPALADDLRPQGK